MFVERPVIFITLFFSLGIIIQETFAFNVALWLFSAIVIWVISLCYYLSQKRVNIILLFFCLILSGGFWYSHQQPDSNFIKVEGEVIQGEGTILSYPNQGEFYTSFLFKVSGQNEKVLLRVKSFEPPLYVLGDTISFKGTLSLPQERRNPYQFNYRKYLEHQQIGYLLTCQPENIQVVQKGSGLASLADRKRKEVTKHLEKILPLRERGLLLGILFGDTGDITKEEYAGYQRAGIVHLFAVSGFHVVFVLGLTWFILSWFRPSIFLSIFIGVSVLIGYYFLVGWNASIARAIIMAFLSLLALFVKRKKDVYTSLTLAGLIILLLQPGELFQIGFQFSFITTWGLVYLTPFFKQRGLRKAFSVVLAAQLASIPLVIYYFNQVSLLSPFVNLIAGLISGGVVILGLLGTLLTWIFPPLATPLFLSAGSLIYLFSELVLWLAAKNWAVLTVATPPQLLVIGYYLMLFSLPFLSRVRFYLGSKIKRRAIGISLVVLFCLILIFSLLPDKLEVIFLDVGQGDSIFIHTPGGLNFLLDGGGTPNSDYSVGKNVLAPFLKARGLNQLDAFILSHNHLDHWEGFKEILPQFFVPLILTAPQENHNLLDQEIQKLCQEKKIKRQFLYAGQKLMLDKDVYLDVLYPGRDVQWEGNNRSLVLRLTYGEVSWLFTGDIEKEALLEIKKQDFLVQANVLKIPHHGSISSYDEQFYQEVSPQVAVISVGKNNFNQPHPQVVEYFARENIPCLLTSERGAILTETDGKKLKVKFILPYLTKKN